MGHTCGKPNAIELTIRVRTNLFTTRAEDPHGAHVRGAERNQTDRHARVVFTAPFHLP